MKILRLKLTNFAHIFSGLGKTEIDLDFTKTDKVINILIGKMGSCKTVILGHLQPFANFGTTDIRNQDEIINKEENGEKLIVYQNRNDIYTIRHAYTWKKDHHSLKSYIQKNGEELNPNGNVSSFKTIVDAELGIEQSMLTLLRLGPNVSNLIDLKATDRKTYVASMLQDAELYQMLYKKLTNDYRTLNAQISLLTNKISSLSKSDVGELKEERKALLKEIALLEKKKDDCQAAWYATTAEINSILKGRSIENYQKELNLLGMQLSHLIDEIESAEKENAYIKNQFRSLSEITKSIGSVEANLVTNSRFLEELERSYRSKGEELGILNEKLLYAGNADILAPLLSEYQNLALKMEEMENKISGFHCKYNSIYLKSILGQLNTVNILINDVTGYRKETLQEIIRSDGGVLKRASKQIDYINGRKVNLQRKLNNLRFVEKYEPDGKIYLPPLCPTEDCPYFRTHPITLQEEKKTKTFGEEYEAIQKTLDELDAEIGRYSEYPILFSKVQSLRQIWDQVVPIMKEIGVVKNASLVKTLSTIFNQVWYDHDAFIEVIEKCEYREKYYELMEKTSAMKAEISSITQNNAEDLQAKVTQLQTEIDDIATTISKYEESTSELKKKEESLNKIYLKLSSIEESERQVADKKNQSLSLQDTVQEMNDSLKFIFSLHANAEDDRRKIDSLTANLHEKQNRFDTIKTVLNDLSYAQKEYENLRSEQECLEYILEAVSPSKGIPLVYIMFFLQNCKDTLNDLISDVFGDTIEIQKFDIDETEFKIPYTINGKLVEDISKASQGQRAIISLALSFALMRQAESHYNIMLLDEMDGPLYKEDRNKFIGVLYKQISAIDAEQLFLVSHNNTFDGQSVNIIMTTDEHVDKSSLNTIMRV